MRSHVSTGPDVDPQRSGITVPTLATAHGATALAHGATALLFWRRWWPHLTVLGLTALAIVVRWWALDAYDSEMWGDEATLMIEARRFLTGGHSTPFINDSMSHPALFDFLLAQVFRVTG